MATSMQYYTITITNSISNASPSDGFVDPTRIENYYSYNPYNATNYYSSGSTAYAFEGTQSSLTLVLTTAKRRANHRWGEILRQLQLISNIWIDPNSISIPGGSAPGWTPTSITFSMLTPFGDSVWVTKDELNTGVTLTSLAAITRCIARALAPPFPVIATPDPFRVVDIFDPTSTLAPGNTTASVPRFGTRIGVASGFDVGPYATNLANATAVIAVNFLN
jgi:hypothetical protein